MDLGVFLACPLGSIDQVGQRRCKVMSSSSIFELTLTFSLFPATSFETAIGVDEKERRWQNGQHILQT